MDRSQNVKISEVQTMLRLANRLHAPADTTNRKRLLLEGLCELVDAVAGVCVISRDVGRLRERAALSATEYRSDRAGDLNLEAADNPGANGGLDDRWQIRCDLPLAASTARASVRIHRLPADDAQFNSRHRMLIRLFFEEMTWLYQTDVLLSSGEATALSPRVGQTLGCLLEGLSEKQIAARLSLSINTVHHYVKSIHRHFNVSSRSELLARWVK